MEAFLKDWGPIRVEFAAMQQLASARLSPQLRQLLRLLGDDGTDAIQSLGNVLSVGFGQSNSFAEFLPRWAAEKADSGQFLRWLGSMDRDVETVHVALATPDAMAASRYPKHFYRHHGRLLVALVVRTVPNLDALFATCCAYQAQHTIQAYVWLSRGSPTLSPVVNKLIDQERRHFAVFYAQAAVLLRDRPIAQRVTRIGLRWFCGCTVLGSRRSEGFGAIRTLLCQVSVEERPLEAVDEVIGRLPGLDGLRFMRRSFHKCEQSSAKLRQERRGLQRLTSRSRSRRDWY